MEFVRLDKDLAENFGISGCQFEDSIEKLMKSVNLVVLGRAFRRCLVRNRFSERELTEDKTTRRWDANGGTSVDSLFRRGWTSSISGR